MSQYTIRHRVYFTTQQLSKIKKSDIDKLVIYTHSRTRTHGHTHTHTHRLLNCLVTLLVSGVEWGGQQFFRCSPHLRKIGLSVMYSNTEKFKMNAIMKKGRC